MLDESASLQILEQGQLVPAVTATDLDGAAVEVRYGEGEPPTVLIWFSPACHVCEENSAFWNDLYSGYQSKDIRFLALCDAPPDEAKAYAAARSLIFPVVSITDDRLIDAYNGRVMPQTAIISPQGTIERVWPGALEKSRQDEITATLDTLTNEP